MIDAVKHLEQGNSLRNGIKEAMRRVLPARTFMSQGPPGARGACLTFDDGPHPKYTPQLLDVLRELEVRATFFMVGMRVVEHPGIVARVRDEGHAIGHHSYRHGEPATTSAAALAFEVSKTNAHFKRTLGTGSILFRPPHGKLTGPKVARLWAARQAIVLWNVDPKDDTAESAEDILRFMYKRPLRDGDIVLMHDTHPHAADALPDLVEATRKNGIDFTTPDCWL